MCAGYLISDPCERVFLPSRDWPQVEKHCSRGWWVSSHLAWIWLGRPLRRGEDLCTSERMEEEFFCCCFLGKQGFLNLASVTSNPSIGNYPHMKLLQKCFFQSKGLLQKVNIYSWCFLQTWPALCFLTLLPLLLLLLYQKPHMLTECLGEQKGVENPSVPDIVIVDVDVWRLRF